MKQIAWYDPTNDVASTDKDSPLFTPLGQVLPLYPPRTWVGLTEDEAFACQGRDYFETYKAIEAKLKEKNT